MAKKISENAIPDINADWGKDASNGLPYSGQAVQTFIKDTMKSLDSSIKKKVGWWCWSTNIDASNFYHLWGFASEDDCTKYKSDPEANASLLLVNEALPISTVQGDSYAAYLFSDVKVGTDYVVSGTDFNVNLRFSAVRTSSGDRLNFGANGSLTIQRSTDGGSTWSNVDTLEGLLSSHDYSTSSTDYDKVNIGKYLTSGTQKIRMRASFKYTGDDGTEKQVTSTWVAIGNSINRTSLNIELSTNQQPYTPIWVNNLGTAGARKFPLSYVCNGNVAKTLHYAIYDETNTEVLHGVQTGITSNGSIVNLNVGNDTDNPQLFTHGVKTVLVYLTAEDGMGGVIYSNGIVNRFMVVNEADAKTKGIENKRAFLLQQAIPADKMSALSDAEKLTYFDKFTNYTEGKIFDYALFVPTKDEQGNIIVDVDTKVDVTFYLSNYISGNWTPTADGVKMYVEQQSNLQASRSQMQQFVPSVEIDSTATSLYAYLHVWFTDTDGTLKDFLLNSFNVPMYSIAIDNSESYAPVSGTTFLLNPRTRNNTEKEPARIINTVDNSVVESVFDNFDFQTDGWMSKGTAKMLHIPSGRKLTIKTNPLSQFRVNPKSSMVMEMDFDVENVVNEDDPIFELGETVSGVFRGLRIYPMRGEFWVKSYGDHHQDIDYGWCEGNKIHLTIAFCANVNPVKYGVKYGTPDVHIPGTTSQYYKDPSTTTIGLVKVFINGNKQREIHFNTEDRDEFCTGVMSNGGIVIGTTGADINLYSLRMYANKEFSDADAQTNYIASRSTTAEKKQLADDNDIYTDEVGKSGKVISIDKVQKHGKNTLLWHGQETYFLQTANVNGWFEIKKYDADGNFLPKHSGSLCRTTGIEILSGNISEWNKSLKASAFPFSKAQGSSAKTYWDWNQQFDMSKFKATIRIPRSAFDSSIVISDTKTLDDGSTVVEIYGGDLGADFPLGNTPKQYPIDMTTGLIEVPDGWIDGNGILIGQRGTIWHSNGDEETVDGTGYYRGPCYQVADGTPFCQKLVNKINNASCQQSHLAGVNNIYNDLHTAIVGQNDLQRLGAANGQNVRVSKYTEPFFYFFKPDDGSDILYRGGCTFGGGKMDKATWGYAKKFNGLKSIKKFCMFEGSDNSLTGTDFRVPFIWKPQGSCPDEMTYSTDDEGFGVSEGTGTDRKWSQCWDFDGGATYSADDELADATHKAGYPTEDIVSAFAAFHNFVYLHNPAIKAYTQGDGTFASFLTSDQAKDYYTKYWMTQGDDRYRLYRYSFGAAAWVDAGLWVQKSDGTYGWDAVYVNSSEPFKYAFSKFGTTYASLPDKLNEMLRKGVVDDFKARLPLYMDPKSLQTYYDLEIHFFCGTDNCGKNTYFVLSQFDRDIQITLPDGTQETHTGVCRFEMHSDDVDTTMAIDNNGRVTHDYDVDRMHPYNKDDTTTTPTYSGMNNVLFNLCEQAWDSDTDNTLRTVMAQIFTIMCTLATERDNIPGWPYEKSQQATVLGALWKYIFFIESYFPMSAYNEQGRIRYEYPETLGFVTARQVKPIWMSQGSMDQYELEFMMRRIVYMVSYAAWGPAGKGGNTGIPDADEGGFAMMGTMLPDGTQSVKLEVEVTAHQTIYPTGNVSGAAGVTIDPHVRVRAGQKYTLSLGTNTFEKDTYFYVYLRNYYRSFGNLANISLATDFILNGTRLTEFVVNPDNANKYVDKQTGAETLAFRPNGFSIGTAKNIQHLDLHGLTTLKGDINLKDCTRLVDINTEQTKVSTVEFPETHTLTAVRLPSTITSVNVINQQNLSELSLEGYSNLSKYVVKNNSKIDTFAHMTGVYAAKPQNLKKVEITNINWTSTGRQCNVDMLMYLAEVKAALMGVIYMLAATSDKPLTLAHKLALCALYGDIDSTSNSLYIKYDVRAINKVSIKGTPFMTEAGKDYQFKLVPSPVTGNNIAIKQNRLDVAWKIADTAAPYATWKDANTGLLHVDKLSDAALDLKHVMSVSASTMSGETLTAEKQVGFYRHIPKVGDFAYSDGTFDSDWDESRELVGQVFMRIPIYGDDGTTLKGYDVRVYAKENLRLVSGGDSPITWNSHRWGLYPDGANGFASSENAIKEATQLTSVFDLPNLVNIGSRWGGMNDYDGDIHTVPSLAVDTVLSDTPTKDYATYKSNWKTYFSTMDALYKALQAKDSTYSYSSDNRMEREEIYTIAESGTIAKKDKDTLTYYGWRLARACYNDLTSASNSRNMSTSAEYTAFKAAFQAVADMLNNGVSYTTTSDERKAPSWLNAINYYYLTDVTYLDDNAEDGYKSFPATCGAGDFKGKENTDKIISHANTIIGDYLQGAWPKSMSELADAMAALREANKDATNPWRYEEFYYPAAYGCHLYEPKVDNLDSHYTKGNWYLPAEGELERLYNFYRQGVTAEYASAGVNEARTPIIANANKKCGRTVLTFTNTWYWASSESSAWYSWYVYFDSGYVSGWHLKCLDGYVRPCTAFTFSL